MSYTDNHINSSFIATWTYVCLLLNILESYILVVQKQNWKWHAHAHVRQKGHHNTLMMNYGIIYQFLLELVLLFGNNSTLKIAESWASSSDLSPIEIVSAHHRDEIQCSIYSTQWIVVHSQLCNAWALKAVMQAISCSGTRKQRSL